MPGSSWTFFGVGLVAVSLAGSAMAFDRISQQDDFTRTVVGKPLTRVGVSVIALSDGRISGRAFGKPVSGKWDWRGGYFCRDLFWGRRDLGHDCLTVARRGQAIRFTLDRGAGLSARLSLP